MPEKASVVSTGDPMRGQFKKVWACEYVDCQAIYAEYVNGCPKCHTGETGGGSKVVQAMVIPCTALAEGIIEKERLQDALKTVAQWKFPATGKFWEDVDGSISDREMSWGACYGSNGERDYMRNVAASALAPKTTPQPN
jgi:hypothetical protein